MDKSDGQESELEQELDQLYRKVAGQTLLEAASDGKEGRYYPKSSPAAGPGPVSSGKDRFTRRTGTAPFHVAPLGMAIMFAAFILVVAAVFLLTAVERHPPATPVVGVNPMAKPPLPGEGITLKDKEGGRYPLPPGAVVLQMEEVKTAEAAPASKPSPTARIEEVTEAEPAVKPFPAVKKEKDTAGLPKGNIVRGRLPGGRYAVQIRAYPEDRRQEAVVFLAEIRKRNPDAALETVAITGRGIWHRILLGDFAGQEQADDYRTRPEVARDYPNSFVQKKSGAP